MQEHVHIATWKRILSKSFSIWLFVALFIGSNIYAIPIAWTRNALWVIILLNIVIGSLTIPGVVLFFKYYTHSAGKKFVITYDSLKFIDDKSKKVIEIKNAEIERIYVVQNVQNIRGGLGSLPWAPLEYFEFVDAHQNRIIVTSYFMDIADFWLDTLTRKVSSNKLIKQEKYFPMFQV